MRSHIDGRARRGLRRSAERTPRPRRGGEGETLYRRPVHAASGRTLAINYEELEKFYPLSVEWKGPWPKIRKLLRDLLRELERKVDAGEIPQNELPLALEWLAGNLLVAKALAAKGTWRVPAKATKAAAPAKPVKRSRATRRR